MFGVDNISKKKLGRRFSPVRGVESKKKTKQKKKVYTYQGHREEAYFRETPMFSTLGINAPTKYLI